MPDCDAELDSAIEAENNLTDAEQRVHDAAVRANAAERKKYGGLFIGTASTLSAEVEIGWAYIGTLGTAAPPVDPVKFGQKASAGVLGGCAGIVKGAYDWWTGDTELTQANSDLDQAIKDLMVAKDAADKAWESWCDCMDDDD